MAKNHRAAGAGLPGGLGQLDGTLSPLPFLPLQGGPLTRTDNQRDQNRVLVVVLGAQG